jgi:hypothetical protein
METEALTRWDTAQVMKDEAGRPFIIVREYVGHVQDTGKQRQC